MSSDKQFEDVLRDLRQAADRGRLAHAYILAAPPQTVGGEVVSRFLESLLSSSAEGSPERVAMQLAKRAHPDVHWVEPESKSRRIQTDQVRELSKQIAHTSFVGGWKVGVLVAADRLTTGASNAFLKTLEEPPPKSLLFLLTESPQALLPTIRSRCQRLSMVETGISTHTEWVDRTLAALAAGEPTDPIGAILWGSHFKQLLDEVRDGVEQSEKERALAYAEDDKVKQARIEAKVREAREVILRTVALWRRDVLIAVYGLSRTHLHFAAHADAIERQAAKTAPAAALDHVAAADQMARQAARHLSNRAIFETAALSALKRKG